MFSTPPKQKFNVFSLIYFVNKNFSQEKNTCTNFVVRKSFYGKSVGSGQDLICKRMNEWCFKARNNSGHIGHTYILNTNAKWK